MSLHPEDSIGLGTPSSMRVKSSRSRRQPSESLYSMFEDAQVRQFKEAFSMMDQDSDGLIDAQDLTALLSSLGKPPSQQQLTALLENAPSNAGRKGLNFTQFLTSMADHLLELDQEADMREAFECFDEGDKGYINANELSNWLAQVGDRMPEDDIALFLSPPFTDKKGNFHYNEFLKVLRIADQNQVSTQNQL